MRRVLLLLALAGNFIPWSGSLALGLAAGSLAACAEKKGPPLHLVLAHGAMNERCVPQSGPHLGDDTLTTANVSSVRLSVRTHASGDLQGSFLCDMTLRVPADQPFLNLDVGANPKVDFYAEAFVMGMNGLERVATGSLLNVDAHQGSLDPLRLYPTSTFKCVDSRLTTPRAFHSATLLPDGEVLIVGGAVANPGDGTVEDLDRERLYLTGSAEVWDPKSGTFTQLMEATPPTPRAFHGAAVINDAPPWQILLVGGVTADPSQFALGNHLKSVEGARLAIFDTIGAAPTPFPTTAAQPEILTYDPTMHTATRTPASGFPQVAFPASLPLRDGIAIAGGVNYNPSTGATDPAASTLLTVGFQNMSPHNAMLSTQRVGATLSPLYGDDALVWGGQRSPTTGGAMPMPTASGDVITTISSPMPSASTVKLAAAPPVQFHTATTFATSPSEAQVLVAGGFLVASDLSALDPPLGGASLYVLDATSSGVTLQPVMPASPYVFDVMCANSSRWRPAGYQAATALPNGDVLLTGGAPAHNGTCNDCENNAPTRMCSLHQSSRFVAPATLTAIDDLEIGRFGHSSTLLRDGTVLIVGGINLPQAPGANPRTVADAEIYNPRLRLPPAGDPDDPLAREVKRDPGVSVKPCPLL